MIADTGVSGLRPAAITRDRRSRSVTMPNVPSCGTRTALAPSAVIRLAASRMGSLPWHTSGGVLISVATRLCTGSERGSARRRGHDGPVHDRPRDEPEHVRAGQQRAHHVGGDAIADRVLGGPGLEAGRQPGDHRRVPEQLARAEQVEDPPVVDDLDRAAADHPEVLDRPGALREDRLPARDDLGLGHRGDASQVVGLHRVEGRVGSEEAGDVRHRVRLRLARRRRRPPRPRDRPGARPAPSSGRRAASPGSRRCPRGRARR